MKKDGRRKVAPEKSKQSFTLKTKCRQLTVGDYIRLVCDDDFDVLVVEGKPDREALNEAQMTIFKEFAELSGAGESEATAIYKEIERYRGDIFAITTALSVFGSYFDDEIKDRAFAILEKCGISTRTWTPKTFESDIKRAMNIVKSKEVRMRHEIEKYNKLAARNEGKKVTEKDIQDEIAIISVGLSLSISDNESLARYAGYKSAYKKKAEAMEAAMLKSKNQ